MNFLPLSSKSFSKKVYWTALLLLAAGASIITESCLIMRLSTFKTKVDVSELLNKLGFDSDFDYSTGLVKYVQPDLEIQFLTPALGRAKATPYEIKQLNINDEGLTYMKMLQDYKFCMTHKGVTVWLPEPEAFTLH